MQQQRNIMGGQHCMAEQVEVYKWREAGFRNSVATQTNQFLYKPQGDRVNGLSMYPNTKAGDKAGYGYI